MLKENKFYLYGLIVFTCITISAIRLPGYFIKGMEFSPMNPMTPLGLLCYLFGLVSLFACYKCIAHVLDSYNESKEKPVIIPIIFIGWIAIVIPSIVVVL